MKPKNCLLLNTYTRTLKPINLVPTFENLGAIMGSDDVAQIDVPRVDAILFYPNDIFNRLTGRIVGAKFKGWKPQFFGILIFVGSENQEIRDLTQAAKIEIQAKFETAEIKGFKFSC